MNIDNRELRAIAEKIVAIPEHYALEMEDSTPKGEERVRSFIWEDPGNRDDSIEIALDLETGRLARLKIDREEKDATKEDPRASGGEEDARTLADAFVAEHAPRPSAYGIVNMKKRVNRFELTYREEVGGLPLPYTGCRLVLDERLRIIEYRLEDLENREALKPHWPDTVVDDKTVMNVIRCNVRMEPTIVALYPSMYEMEGSEPEYRLVYEAMPDCPSFDATTGLDLYEPEHYALPPCHPLPAQAAAPLPSEVEASSWERLLGIDSERYELEKSADDDESVRYVYKLKEGEIRSPQEEPLSVDGYMTRKWGDKLRALRESAVMVNVEKKTGRLLSYHRMSAEEDGPPQLPRKQCWEKAERFIRGVFPEYATYLRLEIDREDSDDEPRKREFYYLPLYMDGIPVNHERVMINVSAITGEVGAYMGVSYEMVQQLAKRRFVPKIAPEAAFERYVQHLRLRLKWFLDTEQDMPAYRLVYASSAGTGDDAERRRRLRYIDAATGEPVWER
ncbi:DUF4901 domain-containing protein [Paenibacillus sp. TRM 82003]|nr:DUF4901 domain-containing protein [Paenibacillus sp. TRM 82003]